MRFGILAGLLTYLGSPAWGQSLSCTVETTTATLRAESFSDPLGDVLIKCKRTGSGADGRQYITGDVRITVSVDLTNRLLLEQSTLSDAVLISNENNGNPENTSIVDLSSHYAPKPQFGEFDASSGRAPVNLLVWRNVQMPVPGVTMPNGRTSSDPTVLRITNLRASGWGQAAPVTLTSATVADGKAAPVAEGLNPLGVAVTGLMYTVRRGQLPYLPACEARTVDSGPVSFIDVREGFANAFLPLGASAFTPEKRDGEAGYPVPDVTRNGSSATQGTRILVNLRGTTSNVAVRLPVQVVSGTLRLQMISADLAGGGSYTPVTGEATSLVAMRNGGGMAVYEVVASDPKAVETASIPVYLEVVPSATTGGGASGYLSLGPTSSVTIVSAGAPIPRFITGAGIDSVFDARSCTPLLISGMSPRSADLLDNGVTLQVTAAPGGSTSGVVVRWNGTPLATVPGGDRTYRAQVTMDQLRGAAPGYAQITLTDASGNTSLPAWFQVTVPATYPVVAERSAVDAANGSLNLSPGGLASVYGANLSPATARATGLPLPRTLANTKVLVDDIEAPLIYVSPDQINFQVPYEVHPWPGVTVNVVREGMKSQSAHASLAPYAPAIFLDPATQSGIVTHADYRLVTDANPARLGEYLTIYLTGVGSVTNAPATGAGAPLAPLSHARTTPVVKLGGTEIEVVFAGLTPEFVGLAQINIRMPAKLTAGTTQSALTVAFDTATSAGAMIAVRP